MRPRTVAVLVLLALAVPLFLVFAPVVPQTQAVGCLMSCPQSVMFAHYSASISFHYFNVGGVYQGCNGYQLAETTIASPSYCF
jgi:hypothetical protein